MRVYVKLHDLDGDAELGDWSFESEQCDPNTLMELALCRRLHPSVAGLATLDGVPEAWARAPSACAVLHNGDPDALIGEAFELGADRDLYKDAYDALTNAGDAWLEHQLPF